MAAHRYWRVSRRASGDNNWANFAEFEMRTSSGGADQTGSGTAISSGGNAGNPGNAFDNNTGTFWQISGAAAVAASWLGYDFGSGNDKEIVEIALTPLSGFGLRAFSEFDVQYSDDASTWTTDWSCSYTWTNAQKVFTKPSAVASRYWRIRSGTTGTLSCSELELRATPGGADETGSGTAIARTTAGGFPASNAYDNNATTDYVSTSPGVVADLEYLGYDFGSGVTKDIQEFSWTARDDAFFAQAPASGWLESGPNGTDWLGRHFFSGLSWSSGSTNVVTVGGANVRRRQLVNQ